MNTKKTKASYRRVNNEGVRQASEHVLSVAQSTLRFALRQARTRVPTVYQGLLDIAEAMFVPERTQIASSEHFEALVQEDIARHASREVRNSYPPKMSNKPSRPASKPPKAKASLSQVLQARMDSLKTPDELSGVSLNNDQDAFEAAPTAVMDEAQLRAKFDQPTTNHQDRDGSDKALERASQLPQGTEQEPIATQTFAKLLLEQGQIDRALAIYDILVKQSPDDETLVNAYNNAKQAAELPKGKADFIRAILKDGQLKIAWEVSDAPVERAKRVLGTSGQLHVRVVLFKTGEGVQLEKLIRDREAKTAGTWTLKGLPENARGSVAIGLKDDARFVSAMHCRIGL